MPVLAETCIALLLTFVALELRRASGDCGELRLEVVVVDLCLGIVAVAAVVVWLGVGMRLFWGAG